MSLGLLKCTQDWERLILGRFPETKCSFGSGINLLELVQRRATELIIEMKHGERLRELRLLSLEKRSSRVT